MGTNRPIVLATFGYIIGIIWGLYFEKNIVSFYIIILIVLMLLKKNKKEKNEFKFISIQKIFRYIKLIFNFKSIIVIILFSSISNLVVINLNKKYENLYLGLEEVNITAKVVSNGTEKEYKTTYKIKVEKLNGHDRFNGTYLYLDINHNLNPKLKYGDYICLKGKYKEPAKATNYQGFDYSKYLRTQKVYGTVKLESVNVLEQNSNNLFFTISNNIFLKIKDLTQENLPQEKANLLLGILLGYKEEIPEEMQENFKESNISHILAVSGLHVSYIILAVTNLLEKIKGKRGAKYGVIFFIIVYMFITNFSPSVVRAGIMGIITMLAQLTYNKNDIWTSISISLLIILIYNPYLITSAGVLLSYGGTLGIILLNRSINSYFKEIRAKSKIDKHRTTALFTKSIDYIQDTLSVSFAAQVFIAPIMVKMFNTISFSFFITNFGVSLIIGPIIISGFLFIILIFLFHQFFKNIAFISFIVNAIKFILENLLNLLINMAKLGKILPFNQIYIVTPKMWEIAIYYILIFILNLFYKILSKKENSAFEKRLINWKNLIKHLIRKKHQKIVTVFLVVLILLCIIKILPNDLKIYFIDVGQGDSTLIVTPHNKTILIDGGGSENYDVGKNTLLPYLLDRKITKIDYVIISHFDTDHVGGLLTVMQELKVKNVIISEQSKKSENFEEFLNIVRDKKINVRLAEAGHTIKIERNLYFDILWPNSNAFISENTLNNNSIVCKLYYRSFSMIFTGDIEEIAEKQIVSTYANGSKLNSTILKVAHHGSKTSSIESLLKLVQPRIALIGVGKTNTFGHPNDEVIERIKNLRSNDL